MHNVKLKNVVFDLGGVLIDWNPRYLYKKVFQQDADMEYFLTHICTDEWNVQQDAGRTLQEGTEILCKQYPQHKDLITLYYARWHEMLNGAIPESVAILEKLKANNVPVYALTNWSHETFTYARSHFAFLQNFLDIVVSGEEKVLKPNKKIYEILLKRNNLLATESIFIDDNLMNVRAASALGFTGIHFTSAAQLSRSLRDLGMLE